LPNLADADFTSARSHDERDETEVPVEEKVVKVPA
jgi:hypothetical protein